MQLPFRPDQITSIVGRLGGGMFMPQIIEETNRGPRGFDPFSKLLAGRIIFLGCPIDDDVANLVNALLMWLDLENDDPVRMFINSPGGVVSGGMSMYDTMHAMHVPVHTFCMGQASSMGAVLFGAGTKGHRYILPHSYVMIHQPLGGARGQASDIQIQAAEVARAKEDIVQALMKSTGKSHEVITKDIDRDFFLHGQAAVEYGIADKVIDKLPMRPKRRGRGQPTESEE